MSDPDLSKPVPAVSDLHGLDPRELFALGLEAVKPVGSASSWVPPTLEEVARLLPQYPIERLIGRGGMGAVYKGAQPELERPVAIKLLPAEIAADVQFVERFRREARTLAKLHHPGIVAVHDFGQTIEGHLYFVMEYVDGTDLRRLLSPPGLLPDQVLELIGQICEALEAAHQQGVIHRDIKPENVLITRDGRIKLVDFGLARPLQEENITRFTATNMVMGTPDYMSPEQRMGQSDHRADIFALGVMFYEMLTGNYPRGAFTRPSHKVRVDARIDEVILKAVQEEPALRYQQAREMKDDVDRIRNTPIESGPAQTIPRWRLIPGGLVLVIAAVSIFYWEKSTQPIALNRIDSGVSSPASIPKSAEILPPAEVPVPSVKSVEQPTITPAPAVELNALKPPNKPAEAPNSASFHAKPPYATFAPPGAAYRIETSAHDDILEVYVVNNQSGVINVQFGFSNIAGGHTDWAITGIKNCDPGSRIRLAALYKDGVLPVTYDFSIRWAPGTAAVITKTPAKPSEVPIGSAASKNAEKAVYLTNTKPPKSDGFFDTHHVAPPYESFVPKGGAPFSIETIARNDCLEIYAVNHQLAIINVEFNFDTILAGHINTPIRGNQNCKPGVSTLLAVLYKNGTSPISYDISSKWFSGKVLQSIHFNR